MRDLNLYPITREEYIEVLKRRMNPHVEAKGMGSIGQVVAGSSADTPYRSVSSMEDCINRS